MVEATAAATAFYVFVVHTVTAKQPFVSPKLFRDTNYMLGLVYGLAVGGVIYGVMSLQAPLLANLLNYPILMVGLIMAPRGIGTLTWWWCHVGSHRQTTQRASCDGSVPVISQVRRVFRTAGDDHAVHGGDLLEPLRRVLADHMRIAAAAGARSCSAA